LSPRGGREEGGFLSIVVLAKFMAFIILTIVIIIEGQGKNKEVKKL